MRPSRSVGASIAAALLAFPAVAHAVVACAGLNTYNVPVPYPSISLAVASIPQILAGPTCVTINDSATYLEQVTVRNFINGGSSITIQAAPGQFPVVEPPGAVTFAAFDIGNASVNVSGIKVAPMTTLQYGIFVSSPNVTISSVSVAERAVGMISAAGIVTSSWTTVSYTSVTVTHPLAAAFWLPGSTMTTVSYSTAVNNAASRAAVSLEGARNNAFTVLFASNTDAANYGFYAVGSDTNTVTRSSLWGGWRGAYLGAGSDYNAVSLSTVIGKVNVGLYIVGSDSNTVTQSYLWGGLLGADLDAGSDSNAISLSTMIGNGSYGFFSAASDSNTVTQSYMRGGIIGAQLDTGSDGNTISFSTMIGNSNYGFLAGGSSSNTVTRSYMWGGSDGAYLLNGSDSNAISLSTMIGNGQSGFYASASASNTVTQSVMRGGNYGVWLDGLSDGNAISLSTMIGGAQYGFYANASDSNTVTLSYIWGGGIGVYLVSGSDSNAISLSTMIGNSNYGLSAFGSVASTVTRSFLWGGQMGAYLAGGTDDSAISLSTMIGNGQYGLYINGSDSSTVTQSYLWGGLSGVYFNTSSDFNTISLSTVISNNANSPALDLFHCSSNTIRSSYIQGSTAAVVNGSTGTVIDSSVLVATNAFGAALAMTGGGVNLTVASTTLQGGSTGRGLLLDVGNSGTVSIGSVTVTGSRRGLEIAAQMTGFTLAIDSVTFRGLTAGATAIHFLGGTHVSSITLANFEDTSIGANVSGAALWAGSRIAMREHYGVRTGSAYENDPSSYVLWQAGPYPGCVVTNNVGAGQDYATIQAGVDALPAVLTGRSCVVIRDGANYTEKVTVEGFINNGSSITIMADPALGPRPVVEPPGGVSFAAFEIRNASVNIVGITVAPMTTLQYGIFVSSPYVTISSVSVAERSVSMISAAGIVMSSWTTVSYTSVTVTHPLAAAFWLAGSTMTTVSYSTAVNDSGTRAAVHLEGGRNNSFTGILASNGNIAGYGLYASGSDTNTVTQSFLRAGVRGAWLAAGSDHNSISFSTMIGSSNSGLYVSGSDSNTVTQSYLGGSQTGAFLDTGSDHNIIRLSTMIGNSTYGLFANGASSNTVTQNYLWGGNYGAYFQSGSDSNAISLSTMIGNSGDGLHIFWADSNTVTQSYLRGSQMGAFLDINSDYNTISLSTMIGDSGDGLYANGADSNTVTQDYLRGGLFGAVFLTGSDHNAISLSTMIGDSWAGLYAAGSDSNTVTQSYMWGVSRGAWLDAGADHNTISLSTVISNNANFPALDLFQCSSNTIRSSYIQGSTAAVVNGSTGTVIRGSMLMATSAAGGALVMTGGGVNLTVASTTLQGGSTGRGLLLDAGNSGTVSIGSVTVTGSRRGLEIAAQMTGFALEIDSVTFRGLTAGATAIHFLGGTHVSSITLANFEDTSIGANVSGAALWAGSRIVMREHYGVRTSSAYENDPSSYVLWQAGPYPGCVVTNNVGAGQDYATIQAGVDALPTVLTGRSCVVIRDGANYPETVTVSNFDNGVAGSSITIFADPASGQRPVVNPFGGAAVFNITNASVSISGIQVSPTSGVSYGIFVSSPHVTISSVSVIEQPPGWINGAGIMASSWTTISYTSVTVTNAWAIMLQGSTMTTVSYSTAANSNATKPALFLSGASSNTITGVAAVNQGAAGCEALRIDKGAYNKVSRSSFTAAGAGCSGLRVYSSSFNTISGSLMSVPNGYGALLQYANFNDISQSTATSDLAGYSALELNGSSSNTITGLFASNSLGWGARLLLNSNGNIISQSTMTNNSPGDALYIGDSASNTVTQSYLWGGNSAAYFASGSSSNTISLSTMIGGGLYGFHSVMADSNTVTRSYLWGGTYGAYLDTGSDYNAISLSTMISNTDTGLRAFNADSNTVTQSYIWGSGAGVILQSGSDYNAIRLSTMIGAVFYGLDVVGSDSNTVTQSFVQGASDGARLEAGSDYNAISLSTMISNSAVNPALYLYRVSYNTIQNSYVQGSTAAIVSGSTGTVIGGSMLMATSAAGDALAMNGGSVNLALSSSVLKAGSDGAAVYLDLGGSGLIVLSTNTLSGSKYGVYAAAQTQGTRVWVTSNTIIPGVTTAHDTFGVYLDGLLTGATIQNNSIYYRTRASMGTFASHGLYLRTSAGVVFDHNRISQPGMITAGSFYGAYLSDADNIDFKFNDVYSSGPALSNAFLLRAGEDSTSLTLKDNVFFSSFTAPGAAKSSGTLALVDVASLAGFASDYNGFFSSNTRMGFQFGVNAGVQGLAAWQTLTLRDLDSISSHPRWKNVSAGAEDFHPLSQAGRWDGAAFVNDGYTSGLIDAADPAESYSDEASPNGDRANPGSYGGTAEASRSPAPPSAPAVANVFVSSISLSYGTVPSDGYLVMASSASDFSGTIFSSSTSSGSLALLAPQGLSANTTYSLLVWATWGDYHAINTTLLTAVTLASTPTAAGTTFNAVHVTSMTVSWLANGNPVDVTTYTVVLSTDSVYPNSSTMTVTLSTAPPGTPLSATVAGLAEYTTYYLLVAAVNHDGVNSAFTVMGSTVTQDITPPASGVANPPAGGYLSAVPTLNGGASDNAGVSAVRLNIHDTGTDQCYDSGTNNFVPSCPRWFAASWSGGAWSYAFGTPPWVQDHRYVVSSSATDLSGHVQMSLSSAAFVYDALAATATITIPASPYLNASVPTLMGISTDATSGVGALQIALSSAAGAAGSWWTGAAFTGLSETLLTTTSYTPGPSSDGWTLSLAGLALENGKYYLVRLRSRDRSQPANQRVQDNTALYDDAAPTAFLSNPSNGSYKNAAFTITGTSSDPDPGAPLSASGVSTVTVSIELLGSNQCYAWGGGFSVGCPNFIPAAGVPAAWSLAPTPNPFVNGQSYAVVVRAADSASNVQGTFAVGTSSNTFTYDTNTPAVNVTKPSAARERLLTTLSGTAATPAPGVLDLVQLRVRRLSGAPKYADPSAAGAFGLDPATQSESAWYTATYSGLPAWTNWSLSSGIPFASGFVYRFEARSRNAAGTWSVNYSTVTTTFDSHAPVTDVLLPIDRSTMSALASISGTSFDYLEASSGAVTSVRVRLQRLSDGSYWDTASWVAAPYSFTTADGLQIHQSSWSLSSYLPLNGDMVSGASYYLTTSGIDDAADGGNAEPFYEAPRASTFTMDFASPVSRITAPADGSALAALTKIAGTADDALSGVSTAGQIEVAIGEVGGACWDGVALGTFTLAGCPIYYAIDAAGRGGTYSSVTKFWDMNVPPLTNQYSYRIWVRARDNAAPAGNLQSGISISSVAFSYNTALPGAVITSPAPAADLNAAFAVSGIASDLFGVSFASVAFQEADTSMYYDGSSTFSSVSPYWMATTLSGSAPSYTWSAAAATIAASSGRLYNLYVKAGNTAGSESSPVASMITIKYDTTQPLSAVSFPSDQSFLNSVSSVTGTASDPGALASGVSGTQVQIQREDTLCWNGATWSASCSTSWLSSVSGSPWTRNTQLPAFVDGSSYTVRSRAFDVAGNTQTVISGNSFRYDVSSPTASLQLPANGAYYGSLPMLSGTAQDGFNADFPQVRIYDDGVQKYWDGSGWVVSANTWTVALDSSSAGGVFTWRYDSSGVTWPNRDQALRVDVRVRDSAGNYTTVSSTFGYTSAAPTSGVSSPPSDGNIYPALASISGTSFDAFSPVSQVNIKMWYLSAGTTYYWSPAAPHWAGNPPSFYPISASNGPQAVTNAWGYTHADFTAPGSNFAWKEGTHDGKNGKTFHVATQAQDGAGNIEAVLSMRSFTFDNVSPYSSPTAPGVDVATKALTTLSGVSYDDADGASVILSVSVSILSEDEGGGPKYFGGGAFDSATQAWLPVSQLHESSWTYSSGFLAAALVDGRHYVVQSSATDSAGNVQSAVGQTRMLYDTTLPLSAVTDPAPSGAYPDTKILSGTSSDPGFTSGINGAGSGVYASLPWHQGKVEVVVFRDTSPVLGGATLVYGGWDATGYFWNGSTWVAASGGPVWLPAVSASNGNWQYTGIACPGTNCWAINDKYAAWSRATDDAGNVQTVFADAPLFFIGTPVTQPVTSGFAGVFHTSMTATWGLVPGATGYTLSASTESSNPPATVWASSTPVGNAATEATLIGLDANTTYYLFVRANGAGTASTYAGYAPTATLAAPPAAANSTGVTDVSITANWLPNGNPAATRYSAQVSTDAFATINASSWTYNAAAVFSGLLSNTTYSFRVNAISHGGTATGFVALPSTSTLAAPPVAAAFSGVGAAQIQAGWTSANPAGTLYDLRASTDASFNGVTTSSLTYNLFVSSSGLEANTTYYFKVGAINNNSVPTVFTSLSSTATLALTPAAASTAFIDVFATSATVSWLSGGNPVNITTYTVSLSPSAADPNAPGALVMSTAPAGASLSAAVGGLSSYTTYYLFVSAVNHSGNQTAFAAMGSTMTLPIPLAAPVLTGLTGVFSSSISASWSMMAGATGYTLVASTESVDPPATVWASSVPVGLTATAAVLTGLDVNTTYYLFVRANGSGTASPYSASLATSTLASPPGALPFVSVTASQIVSTWTAGSPLNRAGTLYELIVSTDPNFDGAATSSSTYGLFASTAGLEANTTYYFQARAINSVGAPSDFASLGSTSTWANAPLTAASTFSAVTFAGFTASWQANGNPLSITVYRVEVSTASDFNLYATSVAYTTTPASGPSYTFTGLASDTSYYFRVRAENHNGVPTSFVALGSTLTLASPFYPSIVNAQTGDAVWRRSSGLYQVAFGDATGTHLVKFQVKASTTPLGAGSDLVGLTDVLALSPLDSYNTPWSLPPVVFDSLLEGVTNYISVKVFNGLGNSTFMQDAFYVRKDTTAPVLVDTQAGDAVVRSSSGTTYTVAVRDPNSALAAFQYSASLTQGAGDASLVVWTDVALVSGATDYTTAWPVDFAQLQTGATNYISVRAWDVAGTTSTLIDAFHVLKDTVGPSVAISSPSVSFLSALPQIMGTASSIFGVKGTEVSVQRVSDSLYWNPSATDFNAAGPVWIPASGGSAWTLAPGIAWADGAAYQVVARSSTTFDAYSTTYATAAFVADLALPVVLVQAPVPDATVSSLPSISGTAADVGAGVSSVEVRLRRNADGQWWNWFAQSWSAVAVSTVATGTTGWSLAPTPLLAANLSNAASYYIAVRASDGAQPSNQGDFFLAGATFTWQDTTPPSAIGDLAAVLGSEPGRIDLSWTVPGDDGASGTILLGQYRIFYSTDVSAVASTTTAQVVFSTSMLVPGAAQLYTLTGLGAGATYFLQVALDDGEGNWSSFSNQASTIAAPAPFNAIAGHVVDLSSQGITAVQVDCWDASGAPAGTTFTLADGSGTFLASGLSVGNYKLKVTWTVNGVSSSLWQDGIAMGSSGVDFTLEINYSLATLTGTLATLTTSSLGRHGGLSASTLSSAASNSSSRVELYQGGRQVSQVAVKPNGRWSISNLLPGRYSVRAYTGSGYTDLQDVELLEGEVRTLGFVFDPMPERSVFAFPNPARTSTTIRFATDLSPLEADINIFDLAGNLVREFPGSSIVPATPGVYHADWDLNNSKGQAVASGVYIVMVKIKGGSDNQTAKVIKKVAVVR